MTGRIFKYLLNLADKKSVRILMYHMILPESESFKNDLIVTKENLEKQFQYIHEKNFKCLFFKDLSDSEKIDNKIILTFDDGYLNNKIHLLPLLEKYGLKATVFIPTQLIEENQKKADRNLMTFEEIRNLPSNLIEIALHSHQHKNYSEMTLLEADRDIKVNIESLRRENIAFTKVLAYPYGKFPKEKSMKKEFFEMLKSHGIFAALRIGNNVESYPFKNAFEVKRIDIKYGDTIQKFKWKLLFGKTKL
ncbi:hypothetical protein ASG01_08345 [Chryseobacterium sp. Leaf180]|nr:hypothetical protein ASG01_08345 [Chryseobacterium sp. Leaf180]